MWLQRPGRKVTHGKYGIQVYWFVCIILLVFSPCVSFGQSQDDFFPYIEHHENGWIDWDKGLIYGIGKGYLAQNAQSHSRAKVTADLVAAGNIIKLAAGININDKETLGSLGSKNVSIQLKAFIKDKQHSQELISTKDPHYSVVRVASLKGVSGLTARLVSKLKSTPWRDLPVKSDKLELLDEDEPWLIIDARHLRLSKLEPALFPRIKSSAGADVYSVEMVDENALNQRGMARYVISDKPHGELGGLQTITGDILAFIDMFIGTGEVHAASDKIKRRPRRKFVVVKAQNLDGLAKTNLVISESDAQQLKKEDASAQILKKCRVVIVTANPVGGIEGMIEEQILPVAPPVIIQSTIRLAGLPVLPNL